MKKDAEESRSCEAGETIRLTEDFPGLGDPQVTQKVIDLICEHTGLHKVERIRFDDMFEVSMDVPRLILKTFSDLYELSSADGQKHDRSETLKKTVKKECEMLIRVRENLQRGLNRAFEESMTFVLNRELRHSRKDFRDYFEHKYRLRLQLGRPKLSTEGNKKRTKEIYSRLMGLLTSTLGYWRIWKAVEWCNVRLHPTNTMDLEGMTEELHRRHRKPEQVAIYLTAKVTGRVTSTIRRHLVIH